MTLSDLPQCRRQLTMPHHTTTSYRVIGPYRAIMSYHVIMPYHVAMSYHVSNPCHAIMSYRVTMPPQRMPYHLAIPFMQYVVDIPTFLSPRLLGGMRF